MHAKILIAVSISHFLLVVVFVVMFALAANQTMSTGNFLQIATYSPQILHPEMPDIGEQSSENQEKWLENPIAEKRLAQNTMSNLPKAPVSEISQTVWRIQFWHGPIEPKLQTQLARKLKPAAAPPQKRPLQKKSQANENKDTVEKLPALSVLPPLPVLSDVPDYLATDLDNLALNTPPRAEFEETENAALPASSPVERPESEPDQPDISEDSTVENTQNAQNSGEEQENQELEKNQDTALNSVNLALNTDGTEQVAEFEQKKEASAGNRSFLPDIASPMVPLQNGGQLNWQFSWQEPSSRRLRYLPRLRFPARLLQGMEGQTVEIFFQVDRQGRVVSASFEQLRAQNWEIGPLLLKAVSQFVFETESAQPLSKAGEESEGKEVKKSPGWLSKGRLRFRFTKVNVVPLIPPSSPARVSN